MYRSSTLSAFACVVVLISSGCGDDAATGSTTPQCRLNSDCDSGQACNDGVCVELQPCEGGQCPCATNAECDTGVCDTQTSVCVEAQCLTDLACPLGNVCVDRLCVTDVDADRDRDGVPDGTPTEPRDNCPDIANTDQFDSDEDGAGDVCDEDDDGDGVADDLDNCRLAANPDQNDRDGNGIGDSCEGDFDVDGVNDDVDNCPAQLNPQQADLDNDGIGDACDDDIDGDGVILSDNCPAVANPNQEDRDSDGQGDACEGDQDEDGVTDDLDNCIALANSDQEDNDGDSQGDLCDDDDDNDDIDDVDDNCPFAENDLQDDADDDGIGNACDADFTGILITGSIQIAEDECSPANLTSPDDFLSASISLEGRQPATTSPNTLGEFQFDGILLADDYDLAATWPGWLVGRVRRPVDLDEATVNVTLTAVHTSCLGATRVALQGVALRADANAGQHANTIVRVRRGLSIVGTTLTDSDGSFSIFLSREEVYTVEFSRPGYEIADYGSDIRYVDTSFQLDNGQPPIDQPIGLVRDRSANVSVIADSDLSTARLDEAELSLECLAEPCPVGETLSATADMAGMARVTGLVPGTYRALVTMPGHFAQEIAAVAVPTGDTNLGPRTLAPIPVPMTGRVQLAGETDHSDVTVDVVADGNPFAVLTSDAGGVFALTETFQVPHTLSFSADGFLPDSIDVVWDIGDGRFEVGGVPLDDTFSGVVLQPDTSGGVTGSLFSAVPAIDWTADATVTLDGRRSYTGAVDGSGGFSFTGVIPGQYRLDVTVAGHFPASTVVTVASGLTTNLTTAIPLAAIPTPMNGLANLAGEVSHGGVTVTLQRGGQVLGSTTSAGDGSFSFTATQHDYNLTLGRVNFMDRTIPVTWDGNAFVWGSGPLATTPIVLSPEPAVAQVDVDLDVAPDWIPASQRHATITLSNDSYVEVQTLVSDGATASFEMLPYGTYVVTANRPGFTSDSVVVTVSSATPTVSDSLTIALDDLATASLNLAGATIPDSGLRALDNLAGANLSGAIVRADDGVSPANLSCLDLANSDLSRADLAGADLSGADLGSADFFGADATNARFYPRVIDADFVRSGFDEDTGLGLVGDGAVTDGVAALTAGNSEVGAMWLPTRLPVSGGFEAHFRLRIVEDADEGAHGVAFVMHDDAGGPSAIGAGGSGLGYDGLGNSVVVEIDTRLSAGAGDPDGQHVSIHHGGATTSSNHADAVATAPLSVDPADGQIHHVSIVYQATTLSVFVDDLATPVVTASINLGSVLSGADPWVGFTGSSSGVGATQGIASWSHGTSVAACPRAMAPRDTLLNDANLSSANLSGAIFTSVSEVVPALPCTRPPAEVRTQLDGARLVQADLSDAVASDLDLAGADLSSSVLTRADMRRSCLEDASLILTNLSGAHLDDADLQRARLTNAVLGPVSVPAPEVTTALRTDFRNATLTSAVLDEADLRLADLTEAALTSAVIQRADLSDTTLIDANLNGANIAGADLTRTNATRASFLGVIFGEVGGTPTRLTNAVLDEAEMSGVLLDRVDMDGTSFFRANMRQATLLDGSTSAMTTFELANLVGANLVGFPGSQVDFTNAAMFGANLSQGFFVFAVFDDASMKGAVFTGADLRLASFVDAEMDRVDLSLIEGQGTDFTRAILTGADLSNATFGTLMSATTTFHQARMDEILAVRTDFDGAILTEAQLSGLIDTAAMNNVDLSDTTIGVTMRNTNLAGADLSRAYADGVTLEFFGAITAHDTLFDQAKLSGSEIVNCDCLRTQFLSTDLSDVTFRGGTYDLATFDDSSLVDASFEALSFDTTSLQRVELESSSWTNVSIVDSNFSNATNGTTTSLMNVTWMDTVCPNGMNSNGNPETCVGSGF